MPRKKIKLYEFTFEEKKELYLMFNEIRDVCNKYRGPDDDIDTPFKYFKNHIAYGIKQYAEEIMKYIEMVHFTDHWRSFYFPTNLKRRLTSLNKWNLDAIKLLRNTHSEIFKTMFNEEKDN